MNNKKNMTSPGMMMDSYFGGVGHVSFVPPSVAATEKTTATGSNAKPPPKPAFIELKESETVWNEERVLSPSGLEPAFNQTDEDKIMGMTCTDEAKSKTTNINNTEEYNVGYTGLSILPWEHFVLTPRLFNELFFLETTQKITYDPEEVNVFFHGKNVMPPTVGDISENGKSWNIVVNDMKELREVRSCLTERCSVFGVTIVYRESKFSKPERAPCLVMLDPSQSNLGDRIYTTLTRAMDSLYKQRKFCVEIDLNGCVERWCRRVLLTNCKAVGAKLIITNGEEYEQLNKMEDIVCCVACFPVWLIQTGIYKLHRLVVYDDYNIQFDGEDLFLHGTFQDASCQRHIIFTDDEKEVFRIRNVEQTDQKTLEELGSYKFMCVKKYNKSDCLLDDEGEISIKEHKTTTFNTIIEKRKDRVLIKELRSSDKKATTEDKLDKDLVDAGKKVRFNFKQIEYKTLTDCDQNKAHTNKSFLNSDDEDETFNESLPELKSSYDCTEMENTNDVDLSHSTGTFFSNTSISESPRLKSSQFVNDQDKTKENNKKYTTDISLFRDDDSDLSDDDQSCNLSPENDRESNHQNKKLIMEMKIITNTLPKLTSAEQSKSKHVEEEAREKQSNDIGKKKFVKQSNKDKSKMKNALKDLMKTTEEMKASLPSSTDKKFIETERNLKTDKKTIASELNATDDTENVLNNDNKARATETPLSGVTELSSPQTVDKRKTKKDFHLEESSSDGDDVQMIYQSDKIKTHSDMKEIRQIPSKPILKIQKGDSPKLSSSRLVDKDKVKPSNLFQSNKKFKMPEDFDLGDDGDIWSSLRSSNVIPVCLTDRTKSVDLTDTSQGPVERDLEILDWDNDNDEKAGLDRIQKQLKYQTSSPNTTQSKQNSTSKRTKRGVNRFDSSRKYLGASVPQKTKKTVK